MSSLPIKPIELRHSIATRLLKIVLSIYLALTIAVTIGHIVIEYTAAKKDIQEELFVTQHTFEKSLAAALWNLDLYQLQVTAIGITQLPSVTGVEIFSNDGEVMQRQGKVLDSKNDESSDLFWHEFDLKFLYKDSQQSVGRVRLYSSNQIVINRIKLGIQILVVNALIKTIALVILITVVFNRLLTRPLGQLAMEAEKIDPNNIQSHRISVVTDEKNELKILEVALNNMMDKVVASISDLDKLNKELEGKVIERTNSLNDVIDQLARDRGALRREVAIRMEKERDLINGRVELQQSLVELRQAQDQLIEAEKMASLGGLVAGVAHEVNTPVGLSLTGISHFEYMLKQIETLYENDDLDEKKFEKFMTDAKEIARSVHISLERAAGLVRSFKQVAVDQSHEVLRQFNVSEYLDEIMLSLQNRVKRTQIDVSIQVDKDLEVFSYPGAWSQIITNFVTNSLIHAFKPEEKGAIRISVRKKHDDVIIVYADTGKGLTEEVRSKIFEPFYTTNRERGGSGLGMNIIYNLVTQQLKGTISVESESGHGTKFTIHIPVTEQDDNDTGTDIDV